jgi:hypothetical protein
MNKFQENFFFLSQMSIKTNALGKATNELFFFFLNHSIFSKFPTEFGVRKKQSNAGMVILTPVKSSD